MDIRKEIIERLNKNGKVKAAEIVCASGLSRTYVNRIFQRLEDEGILVLVGKANKAHYVKAEKQEMLKAQKKELKIRRLLKNQSLSEDLILDEIKQQSGIFIGLRENVERIISYAFTEMLNNAIEHSKSPVITVMMQKDERTVFFDVIDRGVGIFRHIVQKKHLKNELEAIQDLLKGKQTTAPRRHSGEGIFFTSKVADLLTLQSGNKKLVFNNFLEDVFIRDCKTISGTKVTFAVSLRSTRELRKVFESYSDDFFGFSKTRVIVKLFKMGTEYISRSQARRIVSGLDKFKTVVLDFKGVETVGQGFADEIFRVWHSHYPGIKIITRDMNENVAFMVKRSTV
ncbi:MAG: DUF4325 domain-containing protein [Candidatus Saganbacteria bacterium]|nr:DUF4325 domain-containing protein [Candidatus Saganbacteria bacterium]